MVGLLSIRIFPNVVSILYTLCIGVISPCRSR
nr:MAG TPA: hypothetical protein [Caudoviricetes sp.]